MVVVMETFVIGGYAVPAVVTHTTETPLPASLVFEATPSGYQCVDMRVRSGGPGSPVTGEALRGFSVREIAARLFRQCAGEVDFTISDELHAEWPSGDTGPLFERVREVYELAQACGFHPTSTVQRELNVSRATASRVVAAALSRG